MASKTEIRFIRVAVQFVVSVVLVAYATVLQLVWPMVFCLAVLSATACLVGFRLRGLSWAPGLAWVMTLATWACAFAGDRSIVTFDSYVLVAAGVSVLLLTTRGDLPVSQSFSWRLLGIVWAASTAMLLIGSSYFLNAALQFYLGLAGSLALLIWIKFSFQPPPAAVLAINTAILLLVGIPLADLLMRPSYRLESRPDARQRLYAYAQAQSNPAAFERWWYYFVREWEVTKRFICMPATNGLAPFRLRPGSEGMMFESRIRINQLGFRGPEIPREKGNAYRIVTLGESTTFGHTMYAGDQPWPRMLESLIAERLNPDRPVQVINAGIPSYTLWLNIERLKQRILALQPDLIISYHGYNGFNWLAADLPPVTGRRPPKYIARPLKLFADAEYRLKVIAYRRELARPPAPLRRVSRDHTDNEYIRGYRELIEIARTNRIHLALANYSMAVNTNSDLDVIAFYRGGFPNILSQIKANEVHSQIIADLTRRHPDVTCVNTLPVLDGQHEKFIDLVHFTQEGREIMATAMFDAIRPVLEKDLGQTEL